MAVNCSPFGPKPQFELANGTPAVGNQLFFYVAGSVNTKQNTYTDSTGGVANPNPIVLNALGETPNEIWFTAGLGYKVVYAPATDTDPPTSPIWTIDNLRGINDTSVSIDQWIAGPTPTFVGATQFTLVGDQTSTFHVGRRLKSTNTSGTIYSTITVSAFAAVTTVTVVNDSGVLDAGLSAMSYGLLTNVNYSIPSLQAKGDLLTLGAAGTLAKVAVGANGLAVVANSSAASGINYAYPAMRSYLSGCALSTAGSSATMSIAAGVAVDSTNDAAMVLAAIAKTTSAWAVGTGNGGKMSAAAIANSTWYHFYVIQRVNTGVVDVGFDTSASAPTMPTNYTLFRRIGSGKTDGSAQWVAFTQTGDHFVLSTGLSDASSPIANAGSSAVTRTLAGVPTGVVVTAEVQMEVTSGSANNALYLSPLTSDDVAVGTTVADCLAQAASFLGFAAKQVDTNSSAQIRSRQSGTNGSDSISIRTIGWFDRRGRDA